MTIEKKEEISFTFLCVSIPLSLRKFLAKHKGVFQLPFSSCRCFSFSHFPKYTLALRGRCVVVVGGGGGGVMFLNKIKGEMVITF